MLIKYEKYKTLSVYSECELIPIITMSVANHVEAVALLLKKWDPLPSPGISYVAPHLNNLYFLPLCRRWGVYAVVRGLFLLKLSLSLLMLLAGPDHPGLLCFFIARYALPTLAPTPLCALVLLLLLSPWAATVSLLRVPVSC